MICDRLGGLQTVAFANLDQPPALSQTAHCPITKFIKVLTIHKKKGPRYSIVQHKNGNGTPSPEELFLVRTALYTGNRYEMLNSETLNRQTSMFFDTHTHPISEKENQNHGDGLLIPSLVQNIVRLRLLKFNIF